MLKHSSFNTQFQVIFNGQVSMGASSDILQNITAYIVLRFFATPLSLWRTRSAGNTIIDESIPMLEIEYLGR